MLISARSWKHSSFLRIENNANIALHYLKNSKTTTSLNIMIDALPQAIPSIKEKMIDLIGKYNNAKAKKTIHSFLKDPDALLRAVALRNSTGNFRHAEIASFLKDKSPKVVCEAVVISLKTSKRYVKTSTSAKILNRWMKSKSLELIQLGLYILQNFPRKEYLTVLKRLTKHPKYSIADTSVKAIAKISDKKTIKELITLLIEERTSNTARKAIIDIGESCLDELHKELRENKNLDIKKELATCIGEIGSQKSIHVLEKFLQNQHIFLRISSIRALSQIKILLLEKKKKNALVDKLFSAKLRRTITEILHDTIALFSLQQQLLSIIFQIKDPHTRKVLEEIITHDGLKLENAMYSLFDHPLRPGHHSAHC